MSKSTYLLWITSQLGYYRNVAHYLASRAHITPHEVWCLAVYLLSIYVEFDSFCMSICPTCHKHIQDKMAAIIFPDSLLKVDGLHFSGWRALFDKHMVRYCSEKIG